VSALAAFRLDDDAHTVTHLRVRRVEEQHPPSCCSDYPTPVAEACSPSEACSSTTAVSCSSSTGRSAVPRAAAADSSTTSRTPLSSRIRLVRIPPDTLEQTEVQEWFTRCWATLQSRYIGEQGTSTSSGSSSSAVSLENRRTHVDASELVRLTEMFAILEGRLTPLFDGSYQRPYAFVMPALCTQPFWESALLPATSILERNHHVILQELLSVLPCEDVLSPPEPAAAAASATETQDTSSSLSSSSSSSSSSSLAAADQQRDTCKDYSEVHQAERRLGFREYIGDGRPDEKGNMVSSGTWTVLYFYHNFVRNEAVHRRFPRTSAVLESLPGLLRGMVCFSSLLPGTRIVAHTGPSNMRLTCHLGMFGCDGVHVSVERETRQYLNGRCVVFDDSYVHSVQHSGPKRRVTLMLDLYHPDITPLERRLFTEMMGMAAADGLDPERFFHSSATFTVKDSKWW